MNQVISYQEALTLSALITVVCCMLAFLLLLKTLKGRPEIPFLIGFYFFAGTFFAYVNFISTHPSEYSAYISDILGALCSIMLPLAFSKKAGLNKLFYIVIAAATAQQITSYLLNSFVYLPFIFDLFYLGVVIYALLFVKNPNQADIGLAAVITLTVGLICYEISILDVHIDRKTYFESFFYHPLSISPAYIAAITLFIISSYLIDIKLSYRELALKDPLTGLNNRLSAYELIENQVRQLKRGGQSAFIVMSDIDHFKQVNDRFGHIVGDNIIKFVAKSINDNLRDYDISCRFGGEEFLLFLPNIDNKQAIEVAERIRADIEKNSSSQSENHVTASFGLAKYDANETIEQNIERADNALYQAKENGRNKIVVSA